MRVTRYHRAEAPQEPGPEADTNATAGDLFNRAGFALVVVDARGTGASFGTRTGELGEREIKDYGELIGWVAAQPWSNGRVGVYGTSYEGQAAELIAGLGHAHLVAVAALFSPYAPYRSDALRVVPGNPMGLTVQLLPVSAVIPAGHRVRVAIAGHDASCFTRYGPAEETFTLRLGSDSHLDLPVRCPGQWLVQPPSTGRTVPVT